jgi:hypothetical protein
LTEKKRFTTFPPGRRRRNGRSRKVVSPVGHPRRDGAEVRSYPAERIRGLHGPAGDCGNKGPMTQYNGIICDTQHNDIQQNRVI